MPPHTSSHASTCPTCVAPHMHMSPYAHAPGTWPSIYISTQTTLTHDLTHMPHTHICPPTHACTHVPLTHCQPPMAPYLPSTCSPHLPTGFTPQGTPAISPSLPPEASCGPCVSKSPLNRQTDTRTHTDIHMLTWSFCRDMHAHTSTLTHGQTARVHTEYRTRAAAGLRATETPARLSPHMPQAQCTASRPIRSLTCPRLMCSRAAPPTPSHNSELYHALGSGVGSGRPWTL